MESLALKEEDALDINWKSDIQYHSGDPRCWEQPDEEYGVLCNTTRCHGLSIPMNRVCTGQSSCSERGSAEWQSAAVTPQFNVSCSLVSRVSRHLI